MSCRALILLVAASSLGTAGCGEEPNRLYGSLSEVYDLDFEKVALGQVGEYLVIEYLRSDEGKAAKLSVLLSGIEVMPGAEIDLLAVSGDQPRGTLQRVTSTPLDLLMRRGALVLDAVPALGAELRGRFRTTLEDPPGRTLNGDFQAILVQR